MNAKQVSRVMSTTEEIARKIGKTLRRSGQEDRQEFAEGRQEDRQDFFEDEIDEDWDNCCDGDDDDGEFIAGAIVGGVVVLAD